MIEIIQNFIASLPEESIIIFEIGSMLILAGIIAFILRAFKQPLIPAYIIAGILIGPLVFGIIENPHLIASLSEIGVAFLIFTAGLEIKFKKLKEVGGVATMGGILQIIFLFVIGFLIAILMGFQNKIPIYIGLVVAFSSTMVVLKFLYDKRELGSLHGRLIIGILLIQDIVAILALILLSTDFSFSSIGLALGKSVIFVIAAVLLSKVSNPLFKKSAKNKELFLLVSIAFLFLFVISSYIAGLSIIIGAFFAGVALANSNYKTEIGGKIAPIRDFFVVLFFVALGMQLTLISKKFVFLLLILLGVVLILKPFIIMLLVRLSGYQKRTAFLTGNDLAQTSEFSLFIATLGFGLGHFGSGSEAQGLLSTLILLTIITMSITTYFISHEKKLYKYFSGWMNVFKGETKRENLDYSGDKKDIIIFGCHRMGSLFLKEFEKERENVLVVDYNPEIIKSLIDKKIPCIYGDFMNDEVLDKSNFKNAKTIISTIPDVEDNELLVKKTRKINPKATIFVVANRIDDALRLYKLGVSYVILPQVIGGQKGFKLIKDTKKGKKELKKLKKEHIDYLKSIHNILY